jgi:plastocyanin
VSSLPIAEFTAFHVVGIITAVWAVLLAVVGLSRPNFPPKRGVPIVIAISGLLFAGSLAAGISTAKKGPSGAGGAYHRAAETTAVPTHIATSLSLRTDPTGALRFNTTTLDAKPGGVRITLSNPSPIMHNVSLSGPGVNLHGATIPHGGTSTVAATLKPGTYTFYCSVPGHEQAGMKGTLTVH